MRNKKIKMIIVSVLFLLLTLSSISAKDYSRGVRKAGTYFIELAVEDDNGQVQMKPYRVHVRYPKTVLNYEVLEGIDAHDMVYNPNTFDSNNIKEIINQGGAHAWDMNTGKEIPTITALVNEPEKGTGTINTVTFLTENNTAVTVNVFEQEKQHMKLDEIYMTQRPIVTNRFRTLAGIIIMITIIPFLIFMIMFLVLSRKSKQANTLLK